MNKITLSIGDIIIKDGDRFRVIGYAQGLFSVVCIDSPKLLITTHSALDIIKQYQNGSIQIQQSEDEERRAFNVSDWIKLPNDSTAQNMTPNDNSPISR